MLIRKLHDCKEITAGDGTRLRELLHPKRSYPFSGRYSFAYASVPPGKRSKRHRLATDEVYYIISGQGKMFINGQTAEVGPGDAIDIPPDAEQYIENTGDQDLAFLCIVDPAWRVEDEVVLE
jgi:mannose-6-phosphate isomerase-like protein (cupin superfamily)